MLGSISSRRWALAIFTLGLAFSRSGRAAELLVGPGETHKTIQAAIEAALEGDKILVAPGTYPEAVDFKGKKISIISIAGAGATTINAQSVPKTAVVTFKTSETAESGLEGFTLTGGSGAPLNAQATILGGGGIFIDKATPTIKNCIIKGNAATRGGGIFIQGVAGGLIQNCEILENQAKATSGAAGGGIGVNLTGTDAALLTLKDLKIQKNSAPAPGAVQGGGAHIAGSNAKAKVVISGCSFTENRVGSETTSGGDGGGLYLDTVPVGIEGGEVRDNQSLKGGGIAARNQGVGSSIQGLAVRENKALGAGGGGGIYFPTGNARLTISNVEISDNTGGTAGGGGMWMEGGSPLIESCRFINNSSAQDGGAIRYVATGTKTKVNATLFLKNQATDQGGAIYVSGSATASVIYTNCIFAGNKANTGAGGVETGANSAIQKFFHCTFVGNVGGGGKVGGLQFGSAGTVANCILWDNTPSDFSTVDGPKISYSNVESPEFPARPGMLSVDPQFVNASADPPDFRLKNTSPLIDKGTLGTDIDLKPPAILVDYDGKERVADGPDDDETPAPDMGAFEIVLGPVIKPKFVRGLCRHPDASLVGARTEIGDPIYLLRWRFGGLYPEPGCLKACDADDSGAVDLTDAIYLLNWLFRGSNQAPKAPFPELGEDISVDVLTCVKGKLPQ